MTKSGREYPKAYLLTWTTYGTWLHGDERGSVSERCNQRGAPLLAPHRGWEQHDREGLADPGFMLDDSMRTLAGLTITEHCGVRGWVAHAVNARSNHVHAVVSGDAVPETMMNQFKSWITRRGREAGLIGPGARVWTRHGSTRYLWDDVSVASAVDYVLNHQ